jgi:catechol 2,3-dioxygenase-like lactoylglutathione lyase family enzyme
VGDGTDTTTGGDESVREINALTLAVADMHRSVAFYADLGFPVVGGHAGDAFTTLRAGRSFLNLQLVEGFGPTVVWGRAIFWVDDVDALHARAVAAGHAPEFAPLDAEWGERYFHLRDPDGHELSFARPR